MKLFTYQDYLIYEELHGTILKIAESAENYDYGQLEINKYHDKIFKELFSNKKEVSIFLNKYLNLQGTKNEIKQEELEKCSTEFLTSDKKTLESDILYEVKGKERYILIEHQSTVDVLMAERILEYCVEIIRMAKKQQEIKTNKDFKLPAICPIVLYTGKRKWTAKTTYMELQENWYEMPKRLECSYELIDVNQYSKEELIEERTSISKAMLMEKISSDKEFIEVLEQVVEQDLTKEEQEFLMDIIVNTAKEKINKEKVKELKEKIIGKGGENMVIENLSRIWDMHYERGVSEGKIVGMKEGKKAGIKTERKKIIMQMIKNNIKDDIIKKVTNTSEKELKKIKDKIKN